MALDVEHTISSSKRSGLCSEAPDVPQVKTSSADAASGGPRGPLASTCMSDLCSSLSTQSFGLEVSCTHSNRSTRTLPGSTTPSIVIPGSTRQPVRTPRVAAVAWRQELAARQHMARLARSSSEGAIQCDAKRSSPQTIKPRNSRVHGNSGQAMDGLTQPPGLQWFDDRSKGRMDGTAKHCRQPQLGRSKHSTVTTPLVVTRSGTPRDNCRGHTNMSPTCSGETLSHSNMPRGAVPSHGDLDPASAKRCCSLGERRLDRPTVPELQADALMRWYNSRSKADEQAIWSECWPSAAPKMSRQSSMSSLCSTSVTDRPEEVASLPDDLEAVRTAMSRCLRGGHSRLSLLQLVQSFAEFAAQEPQVVAQQPMPRAAMTPEASEDVTQRLVKLEVEKLTFEAEMSAAEEKVEALLNLVEAAVEADPEPPPAVDAKRAVSAKRAWNARLARPPSKPPSRCVERRPSADNA